MIEYTSHEIHYYMNEALEIAEEALSVGEVPVGCVIVYHHELIAKGRNRTNETGHVNALM
jgi:tRNA(Arg) A34 adenosine deaminase TadA